MKGARQGDPLSAERLLEVAGAFEARPDFIAVTLDEYAALAPLFRHQIIFREKTAARAFLIGIEA